MRPRAPRLQSPAVLVQESCASLKRRTRTAKHGSRRTAVSTRSRELAILAVLPAVFLPPRTMCRLLPKKTPKMPHAVELAAWDAAGGAKSKKTKPKNPKTKPDTMVCFAATQNCILYPRGIGRVHCQALCEAGAPPARQEHGNGVTCSCLIYQETCDTVFYRHQRQDYVDEIDGAKAAAAGQEQAGKMIVVSCISRCFDCIWCWTCSCVTHFAICLLLHDAVDTTTSNYLIWAIRGVHQNMTIVA
jgi:hypothetical protein